MACDSLQNIVIPLSMQELQAIAFVLAISLTITGAIALYTHLAGFSRRASLQNDQMARQKIQAHRADSAIIDLKMALDRRTAFGLFDDGTGCLLYAMGDNWLIQPLAAGDIEQSSITGKGKLRLVFNDYTVPNIDISLQDQTVISDWQSALQPFFDTQMLTAKPA